MVEACNHAAMPDGRFAPSPTAALHLGNLRTALVAWLFARAGGSAFRLRMEDLDPSSSFERHGRAQLADLTALGLDWDGPVSHQREHAERFSAAIDGLVAAGLTYPCWCTRTEIRQATLAPHAPTGGAQPAGAYPGTCRGLSASQRAQRRASGRPAALRLRADGAQVTVVDRICGEVTAEVDDLVLRRNDGIASYNLAVVVDDHAQGIGEVVRGDDLLTSTPRQVHLARLLGIDPPAYAHVPLVLGPDGERLAKRDGAITLADRRARGETPEQVRSLLVASLGLAEPGERPTLDELVGRLDPTTLDRRPWRLDDG
jgi:glutamyl-tRNA synthetase